MSRFLTLVALTAVLFSAPARAASLTVQPIQMCDARGNICANPSRELFQDFTRAIWEQVGINIEFLPWTSVNSSEFLSIRSLDALDVFLRSPLGGTSGNVINMWFVESLPGSAYGVSTFPGNTILISDTIFSYNNPRYTGGFGQVPGRVDTIAHEIGHNLGLDHCDPCNTFLMANDRIVPVSLSDIAPTGPLSNFSAAERAIIAQSGLVDFSREFIQTRFNLNDWRTFKIVQPLLAQLLRNAIEQPPQSGEGVTSVDWRVFKLFYPNLTNPFGQPGSNRPDDDDPFRFVGDTAMAELRSGTEANLASSGGGFEATASAARAGAPAATASGSRIQADVNIDSVPEPSTWVGVAAAMLVIGYRNRRKLGINR